VSFELPQDEAVMGCLALWKLTSMSVCDGHAKSIKHAPRIDLGESSKELRYARFWHLPHPPRSRERMSGSLAL
jgi:hypothetical protein